MSLQQQEQGFHRHADRADLIRERREAQGDAFGLEPITLAIERLVQTVLLEGQVCQEVRPEHPARRHVEGCRWLADLLALTARDLFPDRLDHLVASGNSLERFGDRRGQMAQIVRAAARAEFWRRDNDLLARHVGREVAAGGTLAGERCNRAGLVGCNLAKQFGLAGIGLEFLEGEFELTQQTPAALGTRAVFVAAHRLVHQFEVGVAGQQISVDRPNFRDLGLGYEQLYLGLLGPLPNDGNLSAKLDELVGWVACGHALL